MPETKSLILMLLVALPLLFLYSQVADTKNCYLESINELCGTRHGCEICHIDPGGSGALSFDGIGFIDAGRAPDYFCPTAER